MKRPSFRSLLLFLRGRLPLLLAALALPLAPARAQTAPVGRIVYYQNTFEDPNGGTSYRIFLINPDGTNQTKISRSPTESDLFPDLSPDGTKIACNGSTDGITLLNADGSNRTAIPNTVGFIVPVWSPDGKRLLARYQGSTNSIAVFNPDGTGLVNVSLQTDFPVLSDVNWSPDGTRIVFTARAVFGNRQYHLFVTNADGSATPVKLSTDDDANYSTPSWSPDGRRILVSKSGGSGFGVYFVDAVTGAETKFNDNSDGNEQAATWSPDGTQIALSSFSGSDGGSLVIVNADGTNRRVLPSGQANAPRWRGGAAGGTGGGGGGTNNGIAVTVPGKSNLYLAGAAPGTTASSGQDNLANATPFQVPGATLTSGATLSFTAASGNVSNDPANPVSVGPDGGPYLGNTFYGHDAENGLANLTAPINSLIGVFLDDRVPAAQSFVPPGTVNDDNSINYSSIRPGLRQPFYIGDGKDTNGRQQTVVVPAGATRLFLGALDPSDQENNLGAFAVTILGAGNGTGGGLTPGGATLAVTDASEKSTSDATGGTAIPGDTLTYTFTVRNTGPGAATGVSVTAILNGTKFKSATINNGVGINATVNGPQLVLPQFDLAAGASQTFTVKAKVPATFPIDGRTVGLGFASVTANGAAPLSGLAGLNSTVLSPYQTSVSYNANVGPGDVLTFRFTTINRSTLPVSGVASVVQVPAGVNFLSVNADSGAAINVQPDGGGNLRIVLPDLAANSTVRYAVSVRIPYDTAAGATLTLPGTQLIAGGTTYPEPGATVTLNGNPAASPPKLAISKSIVDPFSLAGLFLFDPARAAKLAAAFPQIAFYTTDPSTGQPVPNGPAIQAFGAALNPFIGENDAGGHLRSVTTPSGKQPVTYVTFTLLYENTGGSNAGDFSVTDRVPEGFAYVPDAPASALPGDLLPPPYALINGVPATPATLQVTDNRRTLNFRVKAKLKPGQSGLIVYQLQVVPTAQGGVTPGTTVDTKGARISSSSLSGDVLASPDGEPLLISAPLHFSFRTFTPGNNQGSVGAPASFQFFYQNDGGKKTTDFKIKVPLPANTTFASARVVNGPGANGVTRTADGGALFTIGKVKPGESGLIQFSLIPTAASLPANGGQAIRVNFLPAYDGVSFAPAAAGERPVARAAGVHPVPRLLGVDPQVAPVLFRPITDPTAPRLFIQRSAPLVVENGKPFSYVIVVGNLGDRPVNKAVITDRLPLGVINTTVIGLDGTLTSSQGADGRKTLLIPLNSGIPAHGVRSVTIQLNANLDLFPAGAPARATDDGLDVTGDTAQPYAISCPPATTRLLRANETLALVGSDVIAGSLVAYGFDASAVNTVNRAVTTNSRITTIGGADVLTTNNGALIVPLGTNASQPVGKGLGPVLATGPAGVVSNDGGSLISQDGGGLVASGAGNLIRVNGLISQDGGGLRGGTTQTVGGLLAGLISQDGGGLVASGAGNILRGGGLNLISQDGGGVISNDGGSLVASGAGNLVASGGGNVFATGFSNLIGQDGGSIVSHDAGGLVASGAGNLLANGGGKIVATGGGNIISDNSAGLIGSSPNTAAIVATGGGNLVATGGGNLVASGAGN